MENICSHVQLPGHCDRVPTIRVLGHSIYRVIFFSIYVIVSVCKVSSSRGKGTVQEVSASQVNTGDSSYLRHTDCRWEKGKCSIFVQVYHSHDMAVIGE